MLKLLATLVLSALVFVSCGDDSTSSGWSEPISENDFSSSSDEGISLSFGIISSSSTEIYGSSSDVPISSGAYISSSSVSEPSSSVSVSSSSLGIISSSSNINISSELQSSSSLVLESSSGEIDSSSSLEESSSGNEEKVSSSAQLSSGSIPKSSSSAFLSSSSIEDSSSSEESSSSMNSVYDAINNTLTDLRDNQVYKTVTIGEQIWMAQNLNYMPDTIFDIKYIKTVYRAEPVCGSATEGSFNDVEQNCNDLGRLYTAEYARFKEKDTNPLRQGVCPDGWLVPNKTDWQKLVTFLGENAAEKLRKVDEEWANTATNETGFSASKSCAYSLVLKKYTECDNALLYYYYSSSNTDPYLFEIFDKADEAIRYTKGDLDMMFPIRCIKN